MVMANPSLLRDLVERCETLKRRSSDGSPETLRQLEDVTYTLCVATGTDHLETALFVARRQLIAATSREQPRLRQ